MSRFNIGQPDHIIGIGTGRCGTKSLAWLLKSCDGWHAVHEDVDTSWDPDREEVEFAINRLDRVGGTSGFRTAAVGYMWIWAARELLRREVDVEVVCLRRPRDEFIESAKAAFDKNPLQPGSDASHRFPNCEGWGQYWDTYMGKVETLRTKYGISVIPTKALNEPSRILSVCGVPEGKQATEPWHLNER